MSSWSLLVGGRVILRTEGGAPETEYALFDDGELEAPVTTPGSNRGLVYRTTAKRARDRLASAGVTAALARASAGVLAPDVKGAYARGALVRRIAGYLGAAELFDGARYDARARLYMGAWLDLASLACDLSVAFAPRAMQALYLAALLGECDASATVTLTTDAVMPDRRAGDRAHRRPLLEGVLALPDVLRAVRAPDDAPFGDGDGDARGSANREELLAGVRARIALASSADAQARLVLLERGLTMREKPERGPLADPEVWALEVQLTMGDASRVVARAEAIERGGGRQPATAYLRSRAALVAGTEDPRAIAERVSALAQSMSSFGELVILAAQAWAAANELTKALTFARLVADDPHASDDLRARARELLSDAAAGRRQTPSFVPPTVEATRAENVVSDRASSHTRRALKHPTSERPSPAARPRVPVAGPDVEDTKVSVPDAPLSVAPKTPVDRAPPPPDADVRARDVAMAISGTPPLPTVQRPRPPYHTPTLNVTVGNTPSAPSRGLRPAPPPLAIPGASQPPIFTIAPEGRASDAPPRGSAGLAQQSPMATPVSVELVERLGLPPGLHGETPRGGGLPASAAEARVAFTHMARGLAREYRERYAYELRTDAASLDFVQRELLARYPNGLRSNHDAFDVRRHGAYLSELIARTLGGYWQDIAPAEIGYWSMVVPTRTRVLPFGRIFRFVTLGAKDRDLTGFYADLQEHALGVAREDARERQP